MIRAPGDGVHAFGRTPPFGAEVVDNPFFMVAVLSLGGAQRIAPGAAGPTRADAPPRAIDAEA